MTWARSLLALVLAGCTVTVTDNVVTLHVNRAPPTAEILRERPHQAP